MKKSFAVFRIILILLLVVGCGQQTPANTENASEGNEVTLTLFHRWPNEPFKGYFDGVIQEFEKQNPGVKIKVVTALNEEYKQKINVVLGNDNAPDIYFTWVGEYANKFVRGGKALDLTKYVEEDKAWSDQIIPSTLMPFTLDNKVYGVPVLMDVRMMAYNKELFDRLGLEPPSTWNELIQVLDKLKTSGTIPLGFGNKEPWNGGLYITTLNQRLVSTDVLAKDNNRETGEFIDPGYVAALQKLQQLIPYVNENPNAFSREEERNMFANGKIAMMPLHTIEFPYIKDAKFEWGTFNFPSIEEGKGDPSVITGAPEGFMISAKTKHPDEAVRFLKFLTSKPMAEKWVMETNVISTVKGAVNSSNSTPLMVETIGQVEKASDMAIWIDTILDGRIFNPYLAGIQQLLNGEKTPEQIMQEVQEAAKQVKESAK